MLLCCMFNHNSLNFNFNDAFAVYFVYSLVLYSIRYIKKVYKFCQKSKHLNFDQISEKTINLYNVKLILFAKSLNVFSYYVYIV